MTKQFRCPKCYGGKVFLAPELIPSGYYFPRDLVCPICSRYFDSRTGKEFDKEEYKKQKKDREYRDEYYNHWFS